MREEEEIDAYLSKPVQRLTASDLEKSFEFSYGQGKRKRKGKVVLGNLLWHLVEEELQHRGEINVLLYQENIDPPTTRRVCFIGKSIAHARCVILNVQGEH
jgi:uncharacterized damage-inducible protein DinB